ncbi:hypothetical protein HDV57DRAFT_274592 [Trichoderma longibrachiatum]
MPVRTDTYTHTHRHTHTLTHTPSHCVFTSFISLSLSSCCASLCLLFPSFSLHTNICTRFPQPRSQHPLTADRPHNPRPGWLAVGLPVCLSLHLTNVLCVCVCVYVYHPN